MSEEILFQSGKWSVTRRLISTPSKDWKASEVMAVELSRIPLWSAVAVAAALALMVRGLWTILYWHEVAIAVVVIAALLAAGSIGLLRVSIEAVRGSETGGRVYGPMYVLIPMRAAIRKVLRERE
ncbi:MAG: hypothetical protein K2Y42_10230 [Hyphomicrobium sp.]|uniref:hypothetical protein n=1 Tax=Hyphomicrobium sp. TaxID=82 RepID=UPI0025BCFA85|nr:hypothetical protein [Hyphomicrobium sp.]MBX9863116.1 hypothetical protein [Hyphomicrobium sp.]